MFVCALHARRLFRTFLNTCSMLRFVLQKKTHVCGHGWVCDNVHVCLSIDVFMCACVNACRVRVCVCGSVCFLLSIEICVPVVFSDSRCSCVFVCVNVCQSVLVLDSLFLFLCRFVVGSFVCEISVCVCVW